jgi:hypothetical protein
VQAVPTAGWLPTGLAPSGSGAGTSPTLSWQAPGSGPSLLAYRVCVLDGASVVWQVPSASDIRYPGLPAATVSLAWGTDPLDASNVPAQSLVTGTTYTLLVTVVDPWGNSAQASTTFTP